MILSTSPVVENSLSMRFPIDENEDGVFLCGVEVARLDHPRIHDHAVPDVEFQELCRLTDQRSDSLTTFFVVFKHSHRMMLGKLDEIGRGGRVESGISVKCPFSIGREFVPVSPRLVCRGHSLRFDATSQSHPVKVSLSGIVGRREEVKMVVGEDEVANIVQSWTGIPA